ncbi:MAG: hypothetical protein BWX71_02157 [Deltaproteobacteria bacterium ADurb.Bin072]|nr:MAG: hypothetical protein BWX71_02157 [Deltaproteobacteria bacterium ADurb.Bin072]
MGDCQIPVADHLDGCGLDLPVPIPDELPCNLAQARAPHEVEPAQCHDAASRVGVAAHAHEHVLGPAGPDLDDRREGRPAHIRVLMAQEGLDQCDVTGLTDLPQGAQRRRHDMSVPVLEQIPERVAQFRPADGGQGIRHGPLHMNLGRRDPVAYEPGPVSPPDASEHPCGDDPEVVIVIEHPGHDVHVADAAQGVDDCGEPVGLGVRIRPAGQFDHGPGAGVIADSGERREHVEEHLIISLGKAHVHDGLDDASVLGRQTGQFIRGEDLQQRPDNLGLQVGTGVVQHGCQGPCDLLGTDLPEVFKQGRRGELVVPEPLELAQQEIRECVMRQAGERLDGAETDPFLVIEERLEVFERRGISNQTEGDDRGVSDIGVGV